MTEGKTENLQQFKQLKEDEESGATKYEVLEQAMMEG